MKESSEEPHRQLYFLITWHMRKDWNLLARIWNRGKSQSSKFKYREDGSSQGCTGKETMSISGLRRNSSWHKKKKNLYCGGVIFTGNIQDLVW